MEPLRESDPREIGGYLLIGRLGQGGMGVVYLASKKSHNFAIKVMKPSNEDRETGTIRFAREISALQAVSHRSVAGVHESGVWEGQPWFATEFINGPNLGSLVEENGPLTGDVWRKLASGLLDGLAAIHEQGIIHRDIKPSNVIVTPDGPKIIDFGVAHIGEETSVTQTGLLPGSPAWFSPEQIEGAELTPATDFFSAASTLVYAATGESPWGPHTSITTASVLKLLTHEPQFDNLDSEQKVIVSPLFDKNPSSRIVAAERVRQELKNGGRPAAIAEPIPVTAVYQPVPPAKGPSMPGSVTADPAQRNKYMIFAAVAVVATLLAIVGIQTSANRHIPPTVFEATQMLRTTMAELDRTSENPVAYIRATEDAAFPGHLDTDSASWKNTVAFISRYIRFRDQNSFHPRDVDWDSVTEAPGLVVEATACSDEIRPDRDRDVDTFSAAYGDDRERFHFATQDGRAYIFPRLCNVGDEVRLKEALRQARHHFELQDAALTEADGQAYIDLVNSSLYPGLHDVTSESWTRGESYILANWIRYSSLDRGEADYGSAGIFPVTFSTEFEDCTPTPTRHSQALWLFKDYESGNVRPFFFVEFDGTWHPAYALCRLGRG